MSPASSYVGSGSNGFTHRPETVCKYGPGCGGADIDELHADRVGTHTAQHAMVGCDGVTE
jgi:hypothetical protein